MNPTPSFQVALIQEQNCIGCTQCLAVCPTDAIVGADRLMHTVIEKDCIGCRLCLLACPVDCIEMVLTACDYQKEKPRLKIKISERAARITENAEKEKTNQAQLISLKKSSSDPHKSDLKKAISEAVLRAKQKKNIP